MSKDINLAVDKHLIPQEFKARVGDKMTLTLTAGQAKTTGEYLCSQMVIITEIGEKTSVNNIGYEWVSIGPDPGWE